MTQVELHHGAATDVGLVRKANEDAYLVAPPVFVVADGMGGHANGDVASRIVVEEFARLAEAGYDPARAAEVVADTLVACQRRIREFAAAELAGPRAAPRHDGRGRAAGRGAAGPAGCWSTWATRASTGSTAARSSRSASTTASCRS